MPGECKGVGVMWQGKAGKYLGDVWMLVIGGRGKQGNARGILGKHIGLHAKCQGNPWECMGLGVKYQSNAWE